MSSSMASPHMALLYIEDIIAFLSGEVRSKVFVFNFIGSGKNIPQLLPYLLKCGTCNQHD